MVLKFSFWRGVQFIDMTTNKNRQLSNGSKPTLRILLHSSKTMRTVVGHNGQNRQPALIDKATELDAYIKGLSSDELASMMHISNSLAEKTRVLIQKWTRVPIEGGPAIDSFIGDIYSGLRASELSTEDRSYADETLWILSGLYGFLRPNDTICPYRLEMGYKLPGTNFENLYTFWGRTIADNLPSSGLIVNVSSVEYTKAVLPFINRDRVVTPTFLTHNPKTNLPTFTAVHAKIARGAFAHWLITSRIDKLVDFKNFNELGYAFSEELSTPNEPTFICKEFGGIGLSIRLK